MADINIGQILEALNEKMDRNLSNTDAIGQAILDGKVEVEALLAQNGYAKFTWKEDNKVASLIVQWVADVAFPSSSSVGTFTLPTTFSNTNYTTICMDINLSDISSIKEVSFCRIRPKDTTTSFKLVSTLNAGAISYVAIGY